MLQGPPNSLNHLHPEGLGSAAVMLSAGVIAYFALICQSRFHPSTSRVAVIRRALPYGTVLGLLPAAETFTPELAPDESPPSNVRYGFGADWAICAGGTLTRMNDGFLGRTPPQLTDRPSLHATSFTPEWFRAAPESRART